MATINVFRCGNYQQHNIEREREKEERMWKWEGLRGLGFVFFIFYKISKAKLRLINVDSKPHYATKIGLFPW